MSLAAHDGVRRDSGTETRAQQARPVHELVAEQVRRVPDRTAIVAGNESVTYTELDRRSSRLANHLQSLGIGRGALVGVCLPRTVELPIALLAVMKSGAAYLPLDPAYPSERLEYMASDSGLSALLTTEALSGVARWPDLNEIRIDRDREAIRSASVEDPDAEVVTEDRVYVLYTSGSTGRPKGVEVSHGSLVNLLRSLQESPGFDETDVLLATTTVSFGPHAAQMLLPLVTGARVVVAGREALLDSRVLTDVLRASGATLFSATPSIWDFLMRSGWEGDAGLKALYGGEPMAPDVVSRLLERCASLWNCYGSTETTIWAACGRVRSVEDARYLGEPVRNTLLAVVDEEGGAVPAGRAGELLIGGPGLALGYLGRPELTWERFITDPLGTGERMYRTGDLVRREEDGRLRFLGRVDHQVKVRGFRVEPGEIEHRLTSQPGVERAVVVARGHAEHRRLVAYLVGPAVPPGDELRGALRKSLPDHMVPSSYVVLERLPTTPNGKIDRSALPEPAAGAAPDTPAEAGLEANLTDLWARLLGTGRIGVGDSFFDLGGNSLLAMRMLSEVADATGMRPSIGRFLNEPTITGLAAAVRDAVAERDEPVVVEAGDPEGAPLFMVYADVVALPSLRYLAPVLPDRRIFGMAPGRQTLEFDRSQGVEDIAHKLVPLVIERQPEGPVTLAGHSFGGLLAYEMARQLEDAGRRTGLIALFDITAPGQVRRRLRKQPQQRLRLAMTGRRVPAWLRRMAVNRAQGRAGEDYFDYDGALTLQLRYRPRGASAPLLVLSTTRSWEPRRPAFLGWDRVHRGRLLQRGVPGDHLTMLLDPNVAGTAAGLLEGIAWAAARHDR
jgi:amino acid adenylation domain-containing protein